MNAVWIGAGNGFMLVSIVIIVVAVIGSKLGWISKSSNKSVDFLAMLLGGLLYSFASIWGAHNEATDKHVPFAIWHVIIIGIVFIPLWIVAAFGTGQLDETRPQDEQMRERRFLAIGGITGSLMAIVLGGILYFL